MCDRNISDRETFIYVTEKRDFTFICWTEEKPYIHLCDRESSPSGKWGFFFETDIKFSSTMHDRKTSTLYLSQRKNFTFMKGRFSVTQMKVRFLFSPMTFFEFWSFLLSCMIEENFKVLSTSSTVTFYVTEAKIHFHEGDEGEVSTLSNRWTWRFLSPSHKWRCFRLRCFCSVTEKKPLHASRCHVASAWRTNMASVARWHNRTQTNTAVQPSRRSDMAPIRQDD